MVHSRLVQMQPEVGLAGPNALVLGACGVLVAPTDGRYTGQRCQALVSLFVTQLKGVEKSAGTSTMLAVTSGSVVSIAW
jgi:hypothetical protein